VSFVTLFGERNPKIRILPLPLPFFLLFPFFPPPLPPFHPPFSHPDGFIFWATGSAPESSSQIFAYLSRNTQCQRFGYTPELKQHYYKYSTNRKAMPEFEEQSRPTTFEEAFQDVELTSASADVSFLRRHGDEEKAEDGRRRQESHESTQHDFDRGILYERHGDGDGTVTFNMPPPNDGGPG
jgi:hypothetical protein